ncbi:zinc ribbon domain-containing protein [Streptomyces sp. NBC_00440]|uniref:NADase-type glycan-binding domain-containing protein n=1 Tax=unclassified Streptomyces TaxID=2593676 RepID=UPI002E1D6B46|nr:zinc ribbon domain-containing protein [Streptomyces sp. NBC_00963]
MTTQPPGADPGQMRERTRTCAECGTPSTPGHSFCEGCGAVLSWSPGERAAAAAEPPPAPADDDDEPSTLPTPVVRDGGSARQDAAAGSAGDAGAPGQGGSGPAAPGPDYAAPAGGIPSQGAPAQGTPSRGTPDYAGPANSGPANAGQGGSAPGPDAQAPVWDPHAAQDEAARAAAEAAANERARALLIPVADPERRTPAAPSVSPVLPGRPETARPLVQGPAAAPDGDGGYACPWCATGNRPDRHFCRRCGMSMAERPEGPARLPWWRRLFSRNGEVPWAGDRPRLRSGFGWIVRWVAGAAALGLIIWGALNTGTAIQAIGDHFAKRAPITPDTWSASKAFPDHGAGKAFDELNNTYWEPGVSEDGRGEWLQAGFQDPVRLLDIIVTPGISIQATDLAKTARPHRMDAVITQANGKQVVRHLNLDQGSGPQHLDFRVGTVSSVRFVLRTGYGISNKKQVAIAEVEFFGRSNSSDSAS